MKNIIPVMSGKGGVGKSTVAVNLAVSLAATGAKVALVDADLYGPSVPTLLGGGSIQMDHEEKLIPAEKFGVKYVSIAFFLPDPDSPIIWRGPMFNKALQQLFQDVNWGQVDYCIIDMPPGTGDAQISLAQMLSITGAVVVSTPQEVAMADVRKAMNMLEKVNVEVLGIVENMAGFVAPDGSVHDIFGAGGGQELSEKFKVPLLGSIPLYPEIRKGGDEGTPIAVDETSEAAKIFASIASTLIQSLEKKESQGAGLSIVN